MRQFSLGLFCSLSARMRQFSLGLFCYVSARMRQVILGLFIFERDVPTSAYAMHAMYTMR